MRLGFGAGGMGVHAELTAGCRLCVGGLESAVLHRSLQKHKELMEVLALRAVSISYAHRRLSLPAAVHVRLHESVPASQSRNLKPSSQPMLELLVVSRSSSALLQPITPHKGTMTIPQRPQDPEKTSSSGDWKGSAPCAVTRAT